jgi:hypothetical protein
MHRLRAQWFAGNGRGGNPGLFVPTLDVVRCPDTIDSAATENRHKRVNICRKTPIVARAIRFVASRVNDWTTDSAEMLGFK